ncbi:MAG: hypothetical protein J6X82_07765, partial [Bacteroidales bacterium]|nr:hypothetical protein [Bacteroidales bacterium]
MRRLTVFILLLLPLAAAAQYKNSPWSELTESEVVREMKADVGFIASAALEGRAAGSEGELEAARYMSSRFQEMGVDLLYGDDGDLFGIQRSADTLRSRNVAAFIPGYD